MSAERFVVVLSRMTFKPDFSVDYEQVLVGPFRDELRAARKARTIKRLADTYDEDDSVLDVRATRIHPGPTSARDALDILYGSIEP
jgi:hypothetical protein